MDVEGLHFIDTRTGLQTIMIANLGYTAFEWSPLETYLVAVAQFNNANPSKNMHVISVADGEVLSEF